MGETPHQLILDNLIDRLDPIRGVPARLALEAMRRRANHSPLETMQKLHKEPHPVELLLLAVWLLAEAVVLLLRLVAVPLLVAALALLPAPRRCPPAPAVPPAEHPLALVAAELVAELACCTVAELRRRARAAGLPRALSRSGRRADLLQALAAWEVAACV